MYNTDMKYRRIILAALAVTASWLFVQSLLTRRKMAEKLLPTIADIEEQQPDWINFVVIGDSLSIGLGADKYTDTPGLLLKNMIAKNIDHGVNYFNFGLSGATCKDLIEQANFAVQVQPDIIVVFCGSNDVKGGKNLKSNLDALKKALLKLQETSAEIYFIPCVDLNVVKAIPMPLRGVLGVISQNYSKVQSRVAKATGAKVLDHSVIGTEFANDPTLFAKDKFHPSSKGYKKIAEHIFEQMRK